MSYPVQTIPAKVLDVIALLEDMPAQGLVCGQVGTLVEALAPDVFEAEFCNGEGRTIALVELHRENFLVLRHESALAA